LTDTTVAVIARSFQRIFPLPLPSVTQTWPPDAEKVTTNGDFSPGATPGSLGRLAAIDVTGIFARGVRKPRPTCSLLHPDNPGSKTNAIPTAIFVACETASDLTLLIVRLRNSIRKPYGSFYRRAVNRRS
jgi:hypothetical protein